MSTFGTHLPDTIHQAMETDLKIHLSCDAFEGQAMVDERARR